MSEEGTEADDVACEQTECKHSQGDEHDDQELQRLTVAGFQLGSILHEKPRQEEIVEHVDIERAGADVLQGS